MKIRFSMEIRGCQWKEDRLNYLLCPFYIQPSTHGFKAHCVGVSPMRKLPSNQNPAWCPMNKEAK